MTKRTIHKSNKILAFKRLGVRGDVDEVRPEGSVGAATNGDLEKAIPFPTPGRVATLIGLRQKPGRTGFAQTSAITSNEPNAPFKSVSVKSTIGRDAGQTPLTETTELCREDDDRQAIDRGEDEGTTVVPE